MTPRLDRRRFLRGIGATGFGVAAGGLALPYAARADAAKIAIATNPGLENHTLNILMSRLGYLEKFGAQTEIVEAKGASGPFDSIVAGDADICMVSGYNMVLPRIEQGAPLRVVCAGMKKTALTIYARPDGIQRLDDLKGRTIAVGGELGLLHALMLQLLHEKGMDPAQVTFVDMGSNDDCYKAVVQGEADACCSSISHMNDGDGLVILKDGNMWEALPEYTFQTGYASTDSIRDKHAGLVAVMAAYGALYDFLMSPESRQAFLEARQEAQKTYDAASAEATWGFIQQERPYTRDLTIADEAIDYLQRMMVSLGSMERTHPVSELADTSAASEAARFVPG